MISSLISRRVIQIHLYPTEFIPKSKSQPKVVIHSVAMMSSQQMFQLRVNPQTGNPEWVVIREADDEKEGELQRGLLWKTSYLDMLHDRKRNRAYHEAIQKTLTRPCHVLDIGAGTGLLSMMAVHALSACGDVGKGMVTACESYLLMGKLMRKVLRINSMDHKIHLIHKRSDELVIGVDLPERADVLISEILDSELLGEGLIPTLQHAHDRLLKGRARTIPYRATVFGQLVESSFLWKLHDLCGSESKASDGVYLVPHGLERALCPKPKQHPMHCSPLHKEIKLLSDPFKIFEFDFSKRPESHRNTDLLLMANGDGKINAIISW